MKIVQLQAENFKRLQAVEITPKENMVQIVGRNGAGKSSTLDAIWVALAGASVAPTVAIRKGAEQARIRLDLGELVVTRTFRRSKEGDEATAITVENAEGARFPSPQKMLDGLLGSLSFDPLAFARMDPKGQFETLRRFVPDVDFDAIDRANRDDFARRTDINRRAKEARAAAAKIVVPLDAPEAPIDTRALIDEMERAGRHNAEIEQRKARRIEVGNAIALHRETADHKREQAQALRRQADAADAEATEQDQKATELQAKLDAAPALPEPMDVTAIRARIDGAQTANAGCAARTQRDGHMATATDLEAQSQALTKAMADRNEQKMAAIAAAKMPVDGIAFGDGEILMNGIPFDQASDAEKLRASVAIAMASNPTLRVIRIRDGSLLDDDGLALVAKMAADMDMQVWIERVAADAKIGFVIEDGRVKAPEKAEAA